MSKNPAAIALGKLGGKVTSESKAKAARLNGRKGGRPKKTQAARLNAQKPRGRK